VHRILRFGVVAFMVAVASCNRGARDAATASPDQRPFASFVAQRIIVTPAGFVRGGDSLGWVQGMGGGRAAARQLDSSIARALEDRGLAQRWVMPPALSRTFERNRSYAADPYLLAMEPLRSASLVSGGKFGEPLSSQLRTMIALEADARYVLLPVELRFEKEGAGLRGVLRIAFVDPRTAEARWVGEVKGDAAVAPGPAFASVGQRVADLFLAP
jgi:hypothetical protein